MPSMAAPGGCRQAPSWLDLGDIWGSRSRRPRLVWLKCRAAFTGGHLTGRAALLFVCFGHSRFTNSARRQTCCGHGPSVSPAWPQSSQSSQSSHVFDGQLLQGGPQAHVVEQRWPVPDSKHSLPLKWVSGQLEAHPASSLLPACDCGPQSRTRWRAVGL